MKRFIRVLAASNLLAVLGASFVAGHRHLNPIADLVTDGPSDSGTFLRADSPSFGDRAALSGVAFVDDDPCLACFWHDFLAFAAVRFSFDVTISILPYASPSREAVFLSVPKGLPIIRGPPSFSI